MSHERKISVVGLGYVGLPVAVAFGRLGSVIGFDTNPQRIAELESGHDRIREVSAADLEASNVRYSTDIAVLQARQGRREGDPR